MIYALHGFLGQPTDWDSLKKQIPYTLNCLDLFHDLPVTSFWNWAHSFNKTIFEREKHILIGYSLGGRLAMHALLVNPEKWKAAILISSHPGLVSNKEKNRRLESDKKWAIRFEREPWKCLFNDWNNQPVFLQDCYCPIRKERDFSRKKLSQALTQWSLGQQDSLHKKLQALKIPILWIVGENDSKFVEIASCMSFSHPTSTVWIARNSGHRIPVCPDFFKVVLDFLTKIIRS